jgi:alpha-L-rhamnosidase
MDTPSDGIVTHINCLASLGLNQCAELAQNIGDEEKSKDWSNLARVIAEATNKHLWSTDKNAYLDCIRKDGKPSPTFSQQTQTAAYISQVAQGDRASRCADLMHNPPKDFVKAGSPFFMFFLLEALVHENNFDALATTIRDYWGKQTDAVATTFWEMYQEPDAKASFFGAQHRLTRSHCHGWSAAPTFFLTQYILGVRPLEPGYAKILIAPEPTTLTWAQGKVPTPAGPIECYWRNLDDRFELSVSVPRNRALRIELPRKGKIEFAEGNGEIAGGSVITSTSPQIKLTLR